MAWQRNALLSAPEIVHQKSSLERRRERTTMNVLRIRPNQIPWTVSQALELVILLASCSAVPALDNAVEPSTTTNRSNDLDATCGVYLAPSTIPGAGLGLFAGRDYQEGSLVIHGDLSIAVTDYYVHNEQDSEALEHFLWDSYTWEGDFEGMRVEASELYAASFGIGAAINCFFSLNNMDAGDGSFGGVSGIDRSDPGAGGYTYFHGREAYAYDDIETGFELFLDYGASYFEDGKAEAYGIPHEKDKKVARSLLNKFLNEISPTIHNATKNESIAHDIVTELYETLVVPNRWSPPSRILNAMPIKFQWIEGTLKEGMNYAHYNRSLRSLDWLQDHGSCSDNVRVGTSTVPHAGRGAFLVRPVQAGETILPMPLIHVGNRSWMDMRYSGKDVLEMEEAKSDLKEPSIVHQQMLLNYCFGHAETDILLCPYGIANGLVNHAPTSEQVNARLQWSTRLSLRPEWLDLPPSEWIWNETSGLVLELVATRNLQAGEEILMDYSSEWDAAWKKHVSEWQPPPDASQYMPVEDILVSLENGDLTMPLKNETLGGPFENIEEVLCHHFYLVHFGFEASLDDFDAEDLYPCRPLSSYLSPDGMTVLYNVEVDYRHFDFANSRCKDETQGIFLAVSAQVFDLREKPYSRDQAQPWSFRHDMRIPDDIFPSAWRTKTSSTLEAPTCINE